MAQKRWPFSCFQADQATSSIGMLRPASRFLAFEKECLALSNPHTLVQRPQSHRPILDAKRKYKTQ
jgi:hypothetical protein